MFVLTIAFLLSAILCHVLSQDCDIIPGTGRLCANKAYEPNDILAKATYNPIEMSFIKIKGNITLTSPEVLKEKQRDNAVYRKFYMADSCVQNIEDDFFHNIDRGNRALEEIVFKNVSCLRKLSSRSFRGIGEHVKVLLFDHMVNLTDIDEDFFDSLIVLEQLTIINTFIHTLPSRMLTKMPKLNLLNVYENQLTVFPLITNKRKDLVDKIHAYHNPFDCQCFLASFVEIMKSVLTSNLYRCETPENLRNQSLIEVDLCGVQPVREKTVYNKQEVATATVRIEILIAVSLVILAIVIVVIIVILYKRHVTLKKQAKADNERSPSKIVFQNNPEYSKPFMLSIGHEGSGTWGN